MAEGGAVDDGLPYERCYNSGSFFYSGKYRDLRWHEKPGFPLTPISNMALGGKGNREVWYGKRGDVVYRVDGPLGGKPLMEIAVRALFSASDTLATCYLPRARVEQWMQGEWVRLQQFNGGANKYKMAPVNPRRFRFKFAPMHVSFLRDRVLIRPGNSVEQESIEFVIQRPSCGYWPYSRGYDAFFFDFEADTIRADEKFEVSIPVSRNFNISFDARAVSQGRFQPKLFHMDIMMPNFLRATFDPSQNVISNWPLLPTPATVGHSGPLQEKRYPNGFVVPPWAAEKMIELGSEYWTADAPNDSIYFRELKKVVDDFVKKREEDKARKKRDRHHRGK